MLVCECGYEYESEFCGSCPKCGRLPTTLHSVAKALGAYPDSDVVSLATTIALRAQKADEFEVIISDLRARMEELESAARMARDALDNLMGDTDMDDDDSLEFRAMQELSRVLKGGA